MPIPPSLQSVRSNCWARLNIVKVNLCDNSFSCLELVLIVIKLLEKGRWSNAQNVADNTYFIIAYSYLPGNPLALPFIPSSVHSSINPSIHQTLHSSSIQSLFKNIFSIYLFLAALDLRYCTQAFLVAVSQGYCSLWCAGFSLQRFLLLKTTSSKAQAR